MNSSSFDRLKALPLAALAVACGSALAAEVNPALVERSASGPVDALIVFADQKTPAIAPDADYKAHRRALVAALRARADGDQRDVRAWLDANGIEYRAYWIANVIDAKLDAASLSQLGARGDIARIEPNPRIAGRFPKAAPALLPDPRAVESIPYGVTTIEAPAVWAMGYTGQGVVIAGEDTGYQWDHPALIEHYRGWNGVSADHDYNWHDSIHDSSGNPCGNDAQAPCDDHGHGTHTAGTFAGDDGDTHQIGVAPGARWIGCRNMDRGDGTPARYIECMQFMLAPTDLEGNNPDPDLAPDVVSNSWGCPASEGCTVGDEIEAAVDNVVAGGILFVAAAGNGGSQCSGISDPPAIYDASFVIGATDSQDRMADFSLRGPVEGHHPIRPDLSAPGVGTLSSYLGGGYATLSGTSMATPHVAGAAALLMSFDPSLKGHPDRVEALLRAGAVTTGVTDPWNSGCGGLTMTDWPNYQAGAGRLDVYNSVMIADHVFADGFEIATGQ